MRAPDDSRELVRRPHLWGERAVSESAKRFGQHERNGTAGAARVASRHGRRITSARAGASEVRAVDAVHSSPGGGAVAHDNYLSGAIATAIIWMPRMVTEIRRVTSEANRKRFRVPEGEWDINKPQFR